MKKIVLLIICLFNNVIFAQDKVEELEQFEIRTYTPQKNGVADLVFEARIDNLTEMLAKNLVIGKLVDVSYKIYWIAPSQYKIDIHGLPKGFEEVRSDLTSLIKGKLEFILPEKFSEKLKGYNLKSETKGDGKLIRAIDPTYTMATPEVDIIINKAGELKSVESKSAMSLVKSDFSYSPKSWSNNKLVLDKMVQSSRQGSTLLTTTNTLEYININGIGFPSKITVKSVSETVVPATPKTKEKKLRNETGTIVRFSKYEVNSGKAQRFIVDGLKR